MANIIVSLYSLRNNCDNHSDDNDNLHTLVCSYCNLLCKLFMNRELGQHVALKALRQPFRPSWQSSGSLLTSYSASHGTFCCQTVVCLFFFWFLFSFVCLSPVQMTAVSGTSRSAGRSSSCQADGLPVAQRGFYVCRLDFCTSQQSNHADILIKSVCYICICIHVYIVIHIASLYSYGHAYDILFSFLLFSIGTMPCSSSSNFCPHFYVALPPFRKHNAKCECNKCH